MPQHTRLARRRGFLRPGSTPHALTFTPDGINESYEVELVLAGPVDPVTGMILDVAEVDRALGRAIEDSARLVRPTLERLAERLFEDLQQRFGPARVARLRLERGRDLWVDVWP